MKLGKRLAIARVARRLTQRQLAKAVQLHQSAISEFESNKQIPTLSHLLHLSRVLNVSIQWFLSESNRVGDALSDNANQLRSLGIVDLHVEDEQTPGAYRSDEDVIAMVVSGNSPSARIIEAIPAVLAWNSWKPALLHAFADAHDERSCHRLGWLADITLTIHDDHGFPGGLQVSRRTIEEFIRLSSREPPVAIDNLGFSVGNDRLPPASLRWKIQYPATLAAFRERALRLAISRF